jgi:hypothetical protein
MIAITTSNSISVKAGRVEEPRAELDRGDGWRMRALPNGRDEGEKNTNGSAPARIRRR